MSTVIDCDSHFLPHDAFDDVDPEFASRAPRFVFAGGKEIVVYKERTDQLPPYMFNYPSVYQLARRVAGVWDAEARVADLERIGVDRLTSLHSPHCIRSVVKAPCKGAESRGPRPP
ncbi:MAG TPA: hypothetical protein VKU60_15365, partial [Chloroflexota bacterium]|nr:hypothetical protein [Chloroflexota bacterium]